VPPLSLGHAVIDALALSVDGPLLVTTVIIAAVLDAAHPSSLIGRADVILVPLVVHLLLLLDLLALALGGGSGSGGAAGAAAAAPSLVRRGRLLVDGVADGRALGGRQLVAAAQAHVLGRQRHVVFVIACPSMRVSTAHGKTRHSRTHATGASDRTEDVVKRGEQVQHSDQFVLHVVHQLLPYVHIRLVALCCSRCEWLSRTHARTQQARKKERN
jgi:hypothetical protein